MKLIALAPFLMLAACSTIENPPAESFDAEHSDARAIEIADETMRAMGGRAAWDATPVLGWTFFGARAHLWNKHTGDVTVFDGERVTQINVHTKAGQAFERGIAIADPDAHAKALTDAYEAWINDSYWLVMPYKLKDSGVTLKYGGEAQLPDGRAADKLVLTFANVGVTPQNKYDVFVARDSHLVEQWSFYATAGDEKPRFTTPWADWRRYGKILLSGDRGGKRQLTDIAVFDEPPPRLQPPAAPSATPR